MTTHFIERAAERVEGVDPSELRRGIIWAIANERWDLVRFAGRANHTGLRWFEFMTPGAGSFFALVDVERLTPITVYTPEMMAAWRERASDIKRRKRR